MFKKKRILCLMIAALILVAALIFVLQNEETNTIPFYIRLDQEGETEVFYPWKSKDQEYCIFLPGYAELSNVYIQVNTTIPLIIDGQIVEQNMCCKDLKTGVQYEFSYTEFGKEQRCTLSFHKSGNVAAMCIDTETGSMDHIHAKKGNKEAGSIRVYTATGETSYTGELEFIKGRGNYTWAEYEKKPYNIKLSEEAGLLGMGTAGKWILLANAGDPSNLRNKIVYTFADELGLPYSPESEWVDLYLNGEYAGLYQLTERNEVHTERVDIAQEGSFLVSMEVESRLEDQDYSYVLTEEQQAFRIHYPENVSKNDLIQIEEQLQSVENAILAEDGIDTVTGKSWKELLDLDSWAKKYLIEEIFGNGDAGAISQFYYYDADDPEHKLYAGPVWDYDRTMGNPVAWHLLSPKTFFANRLCVSDGFETPWFYYLYQKEEFYERVVEIYQEQCIPLLTEMFGDQIWNYHDQILQASKMNDIRWGSEESSLSQVEEIVSYMEERMEFLNEIWLKKRNYYRIQADYGFGMHYAHYVVFDGETLQYLPKGEDTEYNEFLGWYNADTDEPFDITAPVTEDMEIYVKWGDKASKKTGQMLKLAPIGILALMGLFLLVMDIRKTRKSR